MNSLIPYLLKNNRAIVLFVLVCMSCKRPQTPAELPELLPTLPKIKLVQGVNGKVLFKEGEFTTSGEILKNGKAYGVERKVLFYELTSLKEVEIGEGDFVKYVSTEIIDSVTSDKYGNFSKYLPEGNYSIFIKESDRLYSKLEDEDYFLPIKIVKNASVNIIIEIDYKAIYKSGQ
jgi:hypothetical protein